MLERLHLTVDLGTSGDSQEELELVIVRFRFVVVKSKITYRIIKRIQSHNLYRWKKLDSYTELLSLVYM